MTVNEAQEVDPVLEVVSRNWGFSELRPLQRQAIDAVLTRRDSLLVVPTGAGKSLCYQAPALLLDGVTVVVSPLIALMKDQVDALITNGIRAAAWNSTTPPETARQIEGELIAGSLRLLFVSPERLATGAFRSTLRRSPIRAFAIDEAHCISHWGHDFRPDYRQLRELRSLFPDASIHGFTATATEQVRGDIVQQLGLRDPLVLVGDLDRPNLRYRVTPRHDEIGQIEEVLKRHPGEAGIVYCIRRKDVDATTEVLRSRGIRAVGYHAGMEPEERKRAQDDFSAERADVVVATVAFGMGIDRSNVRFVVHSGMPKSIEHYQQEAGRAGRDGLVSDCVLLYDPSDAMTWRRIMEQSTGDQEQLTIALAQLRAIETFCGAAVCRHRALVEHFGGSFERDDCGACDTCLGEFEEVEDALTIAQKIVSCVVRLRSPFGVRYVAGVLRGERSSKLIERGHDSLSTFGLLAQQDVAEIRDWITQLIAQRVLGQHGTPYPLLHLGESARAVLRGEHRVRLVRRAVRVPSKQKTDADWRGVDRDLFEALRTWRRETAAERAVPPFVIFSDKTLREIAAVRPSSQTRLRSVSGVGEAKLQEFGDAVLEIVGSVSRAKQLSRDASVVSEPSPLPKRTTVGKSDRLRRFKSLFESGASIEEGMEATQLARSTVAGYLAELIEQGELSRPLQTWVRPESEQQIREAAARLGSDLLRPIREAIDPSISYDEIRLVIASIRSEAST
ncbi:MAG TPA: DNA helicase RecQ [Thermoanaerobaculia bacterium]